MTGWPPSSGYLIVRLKLALPELPAGSVAVPRSFSLILPRFCLIAFLTSRLLFLPLNLSLRLFVLPAARFAFAGFSFSFSLRVFVRPPGSWVVTFALPLGRMFTRQASSQRALTATTFAFDCLFLPEILSAGGVVSGAAIASPNQLIAASEKLVA